MEFSKVQIELLNGKENWATWKFKISILLRSQPGVMNVVEGNLQVPIQKGNDKKPEEVNKYNSDLYQFMKADSTAVVLITNNLSDATLEKVMRFTHVRDLARIA